MVEVELYLRIPRKSIGDVFIEYVVSVLVFWENSRYL